MKSYQTQLIVSRIGKKEIYTKETVQGKSFRTQSEETAHIPFGSVFKSYYIKVELDDED